MFQADGTTPQAASSIVAKVEPNFRNLEATAPLKINFCRDRPTGLLTVLYSVFLVQTGQKPRPKPCPTDVQTAVQIGTKLWTRETHCTVRFFVTLFVRFLSDVYRACTRAFHVRVHVRYSYVTLLRAACNCWFATRDVLLRATCCLQLLVRAHS